MKRSLPERIKSDAVVPDGLGGEDHVLSNLSLPSLHVSLGPPDGGVLAGPDYVQ